MTVYSVLIFLLILSFLFSLIESARVSGIRTKAVECVDLALYSAFGEFQKELLGTYDLFFIDGAYGKALYDKDQIEFRLQEYAQSNLHPALGKMDLPFLDMYKLSYEDGELEKITYATDKQGEPFYYEAATYMYDALGVKAAETILEKVKEGKEADKKKTQIREEEKKSDQAMNDIDQVKQEEQEKSEEKKRIEAEKKKEAEEKGEEYIPPPKEEVRPYEKIENPIETLDKIRTKGILALVVPAGKSISEKRFVTYSSRVSNRTRTEGNGEIPENKVPKVLQKVLFDEYLLEKCSYWGSLKKDRPLSYEIEYILGGKDNDTANLKSVTHQLLLLREVSNFTYLLTDKAKTQEAYLLAAAIIGFTGIAPLVTALQGAILLAWAYAESIVDVKTLLSGENIPFIKSEGSWQTSLKNIGALAKKKENKEGLSYTDFLRILLYIQKKSVSTMRALDVIEYALRQKEECRALKMDHCIFGVQWKTYWAADQLFFSYIGASNPDNYIFSRIGSYSYETP